MRAASIRPRDLAVALLVIVVWGVNFAVIKVGVADVPPLPFLAMSYLFEGLDAMTSTLRYLSLTSFSAVAYLDWVATLLGYGIWTFLMSRYPANRGAAHGTRLGGEAGTAHLRPAIIDHHVARSGTPWSGAFA